MPAIPFRARVPIRFRDTDAMGHVNHAVYLTHLEEARVAYFRALYAPGPFPEPWRFVVARVEVDYKVQLRHRDEIDVELAVTRVGNSSFDFTYRARRVADGSLAAAARTVQVFIDPATGKPRPVDPDFRERVLKLQGEIGEWAPA